MTDKEAYEIGRRIGTLQRMLDISMKALKKIADEDFRGNRPQSAVTAYNALSELDLINKSSIVFQTGLKPVEKKDE